MDVTYNKLFKLLIDKEMKKMEFAKDVGISPNTLAKLSRNELVSMEVIVRILQKIKLRHRRYYGSPSRNKRKIIRGTFDGQYISI